VAVLTLYGELGSVRRAADTFNRLHAHSGVTVCKSTVQQWVHRHALEAQAVRRTTRNRMPAFVRANHCWGVDGTGKQDGEGRRHFILGVIDHGTRRALKLLALNVATSETILAQLFAAFAEFGQPKIIRTDNGSVFTSQAFSKAMAAAGIRHVRSEPGKPWQNGRIERLFGTLKEKLNLVVPLNLSTLNGMLDEFSFWYNEVRPHQHLYGLTPLDAWRGIDPYLRAPHSARWFEGWGGLLRGVHIVR
jgi:transposase InsO family protein